MLYYPCGNLSPETKTALSRLQQQIDSLPSHADKYQKAKQLFASKTTKAFDEVRDKLASAAPPGEACFYCERDRYRDIEHVRPKRHYPEQCFAWENYVYACTICNQDAKRDTYAVFNTDSSIIKFDRTLSLNDPVPVGPPVLIDPRSEDPLDFLQLDLETGRFVPVGDNLAQQRGQFTRDLFRLNDSSLAKFRVQAYRAFVDYLSRYGQKSNAGDVKGAALLLDEIRGLPFPTVLVEMRRQMSFIPNLSKLFSTVPNDIGARPR